MNNSNAVAVVGLSGLVLNASVGMEDVISAFISKYEDQQIADRTFLQRSILELNNQIKDVVTVVSDAALTVVREHEVDSGSLFTMLVKVSGKVEPKWDKGVVRVTLNTEIKSLSVTGYDGSENGSIAVEILINEADVTKYKQLMADKAALTDKLNQVQTNLRDVSRKERQVRGKLAQMKLAEAGMGDLMNDADLLALVNESVLTV